VCFFFFKINVLKLFFISVNEIVIINTYFQEYKVNFKYGSMCIYNTVYLPSKLQISLGNSPSTVNVKHNNCFQRLNILQLDECYTFIVLCIYEASYCVLCIKDQWMLLV